MYKSVESRLADEALSADFARHALREDEEGLGLGTIAQLPHQRDAVITLQQPVSLAGWTIALVSGAALWAVLGAALFGLLL